MAIYNMNIMNLLMLFLFQNFIIYTNAVDIIEVEETSGPFPADTKCYRGLAAEPIYVAVKFSRNIPRPPLFMHVFLHIWVTYPDKSTSSASASLYLRLTDERCQSSLAFSNGNREVSKIQISAVVNVGWLTIYRLTYFTIEISDDRRAEYIAYQDSYDIMQVYGKYLPNKPVILPALSKINKTIMADSVQLADFDVKYICISFKHDVFVIKPNFGGREKVIPKFQGLNIHVYSNGKSVSKTRVQAWPCGNDEEIYMSHKPILVADDVENREIYWTYDVFGDQRNIILPLDELKSGIYFETDCEVELISTRDDWVTVYNRLFIVDSKVEEFKVPNIPLYFRRFKSRSGKIYLLLHEEKKQNSLYGYIYFYYTRLRNDSISNSASSVWSTNGLV